MNMQENSNQLRISNVLSTVCNLTSILAFFGITGAGLASVILKSFEYLKLAALCLIILLAIKIIEHNSRNIVVFIMNLIAPSTPYEITKWEAVYEYHSDSEMSFRAIYEVKAKQIGVNHIHVRYNWSGESDDNPILPQPITGGDFSTKNLEFIGKEYGYSYYRLFSTREHNKGDEPFKIGTKIRMKQKEGHPVSHHLLTSISMVTNTLVMRVILPSNMRPERIRKLEFAHATDYFHWRCEENVTPVRMNDESGRWLIEWTVKPIFGGKYILDWEFF